MTPTRRPRYPSGLTDDQWAVVEPLPPPSPAGAPRTTDLRAVLDAAFYLTANGCGWRALPAGFPPEGAVRDDFHRWRRDGTWARIHAAARAQVRRAAGKAPDPSAGSIDGQSVKAARTAGTRGYDAGKNNPGGEAAPAGGRPGAGVGGPRPRGHDPPHGPRPPTGRAEAAKAGKRLNCRARTQDRRSVPGSPRGSGSDFDLPFGV
jgi:transposase